MSPLLNKTNVDRVMPNLLWWVECGFLMVWAFFFLTHRADASTNRLSRFILPTLIHPWLDTNSGLYFHSASNLWSLLGSIPNGNFGQCVIGGESVGGKAASELWVGWPTRINSEGAILGAVTRVTMDRLGLVTNGVLVREWPENLSRFGSSICLPGDVNRDGHPDLLIGAPGESTRQPGAGRILLWTNRLDFRHSKPHWEFATDAPGAGTGSAIAGVGDLNGDGMNDVLVGVPTWKLANRTLGATLLFLGDEMGLSATPLLTLTEPGVPNAGSHGFAIAGVGDFNGDGYPDAVIGMPHSSTRENIAGAAVFYYGTGHALTSTDTPRVKGKAISSAFGSSVAAIGDINGDGFADVGIGAPLGSSRVVHGMPQVAVYLGSSHGFSSESAWQAVGPERGSLFGASLTVLGDVDGDGYADLLVGSPGYTDGVEAQGAAFLYRGKVGSFESTPSWCVSGGQPHARTGVSIAAIGDVNQDGFADFAVGSSGYSIQESREGRVDVFLGGRDFCERMNSVQPSTKEINFFPQAAGNGTRSTNPLPRTGSWFRSATLAGATTIGAVVLVTLIVQGRSMKRLQKQMELKSERALMEERNRERLRFAQDLHDLMGSCMTSLPSETQRQIREIIWTETPGHDHLGSFAEYLISRSQDFFAGSGLSIRFEIPLDLPRYPLKGRVRKELFLATFAALANARQHAQATWVLLRMHQEASRLIILVEDNGRGFPDEVLRCDVHAIRSDGTGNGLPNMKSRISALGGTIELRPRAEGGAVVSFSVPLSPEGYQDNRA